MRSHRRYVKVLAALFGALWLALALAPHDRATWALENAPVVLFAAAMAASYRGLLLSRVSYTAIFVFLCVHAIGAHYTYSEVPYDRWFEALTGASLNGLMGWQRNHFDRFAHLLYGLLLAYPVREVFLRVADVRGFWGYFLPLDVMLSSSAFYELIEWGAAGLFGAGVGTAYLGAQGDLWDAQRDMALAGGGALAAILAIAAINARRQRDFASEMRESLRVKSGVPF